jgi:hypothetical protein
LDRDGRIDVVVTNARTYQGIGEAGVSVLLQNPAVPRALLAPAYYAATPVVADLAVADLNGDGWPDLAAAAGTSSNSFTVWLQDSTRPGIFGAPTKYAAGTYGNSIAVGQFNDDALPDVAVAVYDSVKVFFNSPAAPGTFNAPISLRR